MFSFFRRKAPAPDTPSNPPAAAVAAAVVAEPAPPPAPRGKWLDRLRGGLRRTGSSIAQVFTGTRIDDALYEDLESALLMADAGVAATEYLLADLKRRVKEHKLTEPQAVKGLLADALITHGIAIARLKQSERAQFTFQKAIEVGYQVGALNKAGLAALTLLEKLDDLPAETLYAAYDRASEWLAKSQSQDILLRLNAAARKVFTNIRGELKPEVATEIVFNTPCTFPLEVLKFEAGLIGQALAQANGSVTHAAHLLGMTYQGLAYVIGSRHHDLLKARSPIHRRATKSKGVEVEESSRNE